MNTVVAAIRPRGATCAVARIPLTLFVLAATGLLRPAVASAQTEPDVPVAAVPDTSEPTAGEDITGATIDAAPETPSPAIGSAPEPVEPENPPTSPSPPPPPPPPPPAPANAPEPGTRVDPELADLIGADLAAELAADETAITGRENPNPAYLSTGQGAQTAAVGGGALGASRLMNPAISLISTFAGSYFTNETHVARGGHVPSTTGFHIVENELGIEAAIDPYFYLKGYFLFGPTFFETEEAYAETLRLPWGFKIRAGQMLLSFGRTNPTHPHAWEFIDAPLPNLRFFSGEGLRAPGAELSWLLPVPFYLKLLGSVHSTAGVPPAGSTADEHTFGTDEDYDFLYLGRLETFIPFDDEWSMMLGASMVTGPAGQGGDTHSDVFGGDLFLRYKPVATDSNFEMSFEAEGMCRQRQFPGTRLVDWAVWAELTLRLDQRWRLALRGDASGGDLTRGELMTGPAKDMAEERGALSIAFVPSEFSLIRLQGNLSHPHGEAWTGPDYVGEIHLQLMFAAGAHGAHSF